MPAHLNFTEFTDDEILWVNKEAVNQFFNSVTIGDASENDAGVIFAAANQAALGASTYVSINILDELGVVTTTQIVSKDAFDALKAAYDDLILKLKVAGTMVGD